MYEKWKKAVIHLECATDSIHYTDQIKRQNELLERFNNGWISGEEYLEGKKIKSRDIRFHGTAIFVSHNEKLYLLTARHVLFDGISAAREHKAALERLQEDFHFDYQRKEAELQEDALDTIYKIIFRVPSLDEVLSDEKSNDREYLMNLSAGTTNSRSYTFSSPELDLAIISLNQMYDYFADGLIKLGYQPIPSDLIRDHPSSVGADVFTVGFPSSTAILGTSSPHEDMPAWASCVLSNPVFSWGKVSMLSKHLAFYWCDMSIYPGNSGGPVVEDGCLVGIVSEQAMLPVEGAPQISTRIPFGKIIKTGFVKQLIEEQEAKDQKHRR
ncbi:S1 family peptidase [Raoultella planticola]|uniref:S1 family peptidase n=1 Tax=Raoultella planticola TaxID=575 RepID=UPI00062B71CC|nr:serine protease [Raoultella planticola]